MSILAASISLHKSAAFFSLLSEALGSKRPIRCDFLYARTVSGSDEYVSTGISYFGMDEDGGIIVDEAGSVEAT